MPYKFEITDLELLYSKLTGGSQTDELLKQLCDSLVQNEEWKEKESAPKIPRAAIHLVANCITLPYLGTSDNFVSRIVFENQTLNLNTNICYQSEKDSTIPHDIGLVATALSVPNKGEVLDIPIEDEDGYFATQHQIGVKNQYPAKGLTVKSGISPAKPILIRHAGDLEFALNEHYATITKALDAVNPIEEKRKIHIAYNIRQEQ